MLPLKRILCATDFHDSSYESVKMSNELAEHFDAELLLVHIISPTPVIPSITEEISPTFDVISYQNDLEKAVRTLLQKMVSALISPNVKVRIFVAVGYPAEEIAKLAEKEEVGLIVITIHSHSRWRNLIFGSKAAKIMRIAHRPILSIRQLGFKNFY